MERERLHPLLFAFRAGKKSGWAVLIVVRFKTVPSRRRIYFAKRSYRSAKTHAMVARMYALSSSWW